MELKEYICYFNEKNIHNYTTTYINNYDFMSVK